MQLEPPQRKRFRNDGWPKKGCRLVRMVVLLGRRRRQMSTAAINLALYAVLVIAYFLVVLQWLNEPLARLFQENLIHYALASVLLILGQGILLDIVASNLLRLAKLVNRPHLGWGRKRKE